MKKKSTGKGMMIVGRMSKAGVTVYLRQGQMVTRTSHSSERRSNTLGQFVARQKMRHTMALWKMLRFCQVWFTERQTAYQNFASLANRLPAVYVTKGLMDKASFLMPGIPMSDGKLPTIHEQLGEVDGTPALMTDLKGEAYDLQTMLLLYTAEQHIDTYMPRVQFSVREVAWEEMTVVDGHYVLKGETFADNMKGWALVLVKGQRCSPQTIVTRCALYQQYTTEDALEKAADSYGGLTEAPFLFP